MSEPGAQAQVRTNQLILNSARKRIDKRREELYQSAEVVKYGPRGENRSSVITQRIEMVPLHQIVEDPSFTNLRLSVNPEDLDALADSMKHEGLKVPITLIPVSENASYFHVRAGFRRTLVAQTLKWKAIPAIIIPYNTPTVEEYWTNIIENSARSQLHSYEVACAARTMRDRFHITPQEFATRAGYSPSYIHNLLRALDRLPPEVLKAWREKERVPVDLFIQWSILEPGEALKAMLSYAGRNPRVVGNWHPQQPKRPLLIKMASSRGLARMQKVRFAIEVARPLNHQTRTLCLQLVDYCSGARDDVPGVFNPHKKQRIYTSRRREDLPPPNPHENPPPPDFDQKDDDK